MDSVQPQPAPSIRPGTVERAFQIARAGGCEGMSDLVRILKDEKFEKVDEHLAGQSIRRDLRRAWETVALANAAATGEPAPELGR